MKKEKYEIEYISSATGFGWDKKRDTIKEVEYLISDLVRSYTAFVNVWDNELHDFIFRKDCLTNKFDVDFIFTNRKRDLRTKTRETVRM